MPTFKNISASYVDSDGSIRRWNGSKLGEMSLQEVGSRTRIQNGQSVIASDEFLAHHGRGREFFGVPAARVEVTDRVFGGKPKLRFVAHNGKTIPLSAETKQRIKAISAQELAQRRDSWRGPDVLMSDENFRNHVANRSGNNASTSES